MLSRTADSLFWLARYVERADNTARIIDAANRLAAMPIVYAGSSNEWESALAAAGASARFHDTNDGDDPTATRSSISSPSRRTIRPASSRASTPPATTPAPCAPR